MSNPMEEAQVRTLAAATRVGEYWTQKEIDTLYEDFDNGSSLEEIALKLSRTYYAVSSMHTLTHREASEWANDARKKGTRVVTQFDRGYTDIESLFNDES